MKYIKLYEAFESEILSKTLKFLSNKGKSDLLERLKSIANSIDMPLSKYSDDYFQYLPFNKALELNYNPLAGDVPCDADSSDVFDSDAAIKGEKCQGGVIKRKWGRGVRSVKCAKCDGTGIKPSQSKLKWIKFWF